MLEYSQHAAKQTRTNAIILHWAAIDYARAYNTRLMESISKSDGLHTMPP